MARFYVTYIQRNGALEKLLGPDVPFRQHRQAWKNPPMDAERIWQFTSFRSKRVAEAAVPSPQPEAAPPPESTDSEPSFDLDSFSDEIRSKIAEADGVHQKLSGLKRSTVSRLVAQGFDPEWSKQFFDDLSA